MINGVDGEEDDDDSLSNNINCKTCSASIIRLMNLRKKLLGMANSLFSI